MVDGAGDRDDGRSWHATGRSIHDENRTELTIVRLEAKFDGFIQAQQIRDATITRDLTYIRETHVATSTDHEARIRLLEQKRYVEPKTVWTAFTILTAIGTLVVAIVNLATK